MSHGIKGEAHEMAASSRLRGESTMARPTGAEVASGVARHRGVRIDRYLALAACASAGGLVAAEAGAAIVGSAAGWSVTKSVANSNNSTAATFGAGATHLNSKFNFKARRSTSTQINRSVVIQGFLGGYFGRSRLASGVVVGPTAPPPGPGWRSGQEKCVESVSVGASFYGFNRNWGSLLGTGTVSIRGFVPIRFTIGAGTHYGYFDLEVFRTGIRINSAIGFTLHGWAYNDQAGQSIAMGATPSAVPGGAGLAALAFGAAGLRGRRRSRN